MMLVEIGQRFGRLVVKAEAEKNARGQTRVKCVCDCGKESTVYQDSLRRGHSTSCGCLKSDKAKAVIAKRWSTRMRGKSTPRSSFDDWSELP